MENKSLHEIIEIANDLSHEIALHGYPRVEAYGEIESIIFLAAVTKDNNLPLSFSDEDYVRRYFNGAEKVKNINLNNVLQNIVLYGNKAEKLYMKLISISDDDIKEFFEYLQAMKSKESSRYSTESSTTSDIAKLVMYLCADCNKGSFVDICSGEGAVLTEALNSGFEKLDGYEINLNSSLLAKMRGVINKTTFNIKECDVLQEKMRKEYDCVFTQPPFALRTYRPTEKDYDETLKYSESNRVIKADWHFVLKAINATKKDGKTIALVAAGALFNTPDSFYRKQIVENKMLEKVISLPTGIIPLTGISTDILVFSNGNEEVEFVDASECFIKTKGYERKLDVEEIVCLLEQETSYKVAFANYDDIRRNDYFLNVSKYINTETDNKLVNASSLKEYAEVIPGYQYTTRNIQELEPGEGNISIVKITNVVNGKIDYDNLVSVNVDQTKIEKYLLKENDILVATKGTALKFALVEDSTGKRLIPHSNMTIIRCNEKLEPLYLISFLRSQIGTTLFKGIQTGSIIMNITAKAIENFQIPVVDDDTQKVIASRYRIINKEIIRIKEELAAAEKKLETLWEDEVDD